MLAVVRVHHPDPYTALQQMLDDSPFSWGIRAYEKALYLDELSDEAINVLVEQATDKTSPMSFMSIFRLDGAFTQVGEQDTAFGGTRTSTCSPNKTTTTACERPTGRRNTTGWP